MKKRFMSFVCIMLLIVPLLSGLSENAHAAAAPRELTILYTHDMHDYYYPTVTVEGGQVIEHGGAARLKTLLEKNTDENTIYIDGGDYSMGTLYQAAFATDAYELRNLGLCGCLVTTFGNHEFDYGAGKLAEMLRSAKTSGDRLPAIVESNIVFGENLTGEQRVLKEAMEEYGVRDYLIKEVNGYKVGIFGVNGLDSVECIQSDVEFENYIEAAGRTTDELKKNGCDIIIALSHSGTEKDGENGEDFELARAVPEIDVILSAHTHCCYDRPVMCGSTVLVSAGEYLKNLGRLVITKENGKLNVVSLELLPVDSSVEDDPETEERFARYRAEIEAGYLKDIGGFDETVCHSSFTLPSVSEMYAEHTEYAMGEIIADSYMAAAEKAGITDADVALVGLGTIRSSIHEGDITTADIFNICSLGVGGDETAGHPLITVYITGSELKLLMELEASGGSFMADVRMSYSGAMLKYNTKRIILDRITELGICRKDGSIEEIENDRLYRVIVNMYAYNMLGMLNGMSKGIITIKPKNADGSEITDAYLLAIKDENGNEVKEWTALRDYLMSFDKNGNGIPEIPDMYSAPLQRKVAYEEGGFAVIAHPGRATKLMPILLTIVFIILVLLIFGIVKLIKRIRRKRKQKREVQE